MSYTLFLCWISLASLLSTVVLVTDSCSSTFGRKAKRSAIETSTPATTKTILPTTTNYTIMTEPTAATASTTIDKTLKQDGYTHVSLCEGMYASDFCLNGGTCYMHIVMEALEYGCECSTHFHGLRCESKNLEGSYGGGMIIKGSNGRRRRRSQFGSPRRMNPGRKSHHIHHRNHRFSSTSAP